MSLNSNDLPAGGGGNINPMEPGTYPARTVCMIDLGMQARPPFQGKDKPPVNMIAMTYEFVDEFLKDEDGEDIVDKPRWLTEMMPVYQLTAEKAKSTARYRALDPATVHKGDFGKLVDTPCMVTVVHNPNKVTGGVYENIGGVTAMREKDAKKCAELVNEVRVFDLDEPTVEGFEALPPFIQKKIKGGLEYEGSKLYGMLGDEDAAFDKERAEADIHAQDDTDSPY